MTASFNSKAIQAGPGELYLALSLATVVGVTTTAIVKELFGTFYVDGDIRLALKGGIVPWAVLNNGGFKGKLKQKALKANPNNAPEFTIGYEEIGYEAEVVAMDADVQKMKDVLSAQTAQVLTLAASATQAARETILGGGQTQATEYMAMYRFESRKVPGEFRNILIPACTLESDSDLERSKGKISELKVKIVAKGFDLLLDPVTGKPVVWMEDYVTAAHS